MKILVRNTADHYLIPGNEGQVLEVNGTEYRIVEIVAIAHQPMLPAMVYPRDNGYGVRLIPVQVDVTLEAVQ